MKILSLLLFTVAVVKAVNPVQLAPYRQAQASFHALDAPALPATLQQSRTEATSTDGARWRGTDRGLWREDPKAPPADRTRYFASRRWLHDDKVLSLSPDNSGGMWVRTETGISHIEFIRTTLAAKAAYFEKRVQARHNRHGLVASSHLRDPGNLDSNQSVSSDNDGLWTALYAAAECYRYAITKSPEALRFATAAVEAVLKLEQITGRPGLPARSYLLPSEQRPRDGVWFPASDGSLVWKGDTSSDEIAGHYYIFSIAYDLLPDAVLKRRILETTRRMTNHILDNGLMLTDIHGLATWWGRWDKEYFASERGHGDSPLNAIEILSFLKTAHHITQDPRYEQQYRRLAIDEGYAAIGEKYREWRETINYSDEELAMISFYPLLQYEKDPKLLKSIRNSLSLWWENMERQKNPLWTFIYLTGNPQGRAGIADAVWTLERIPMDLVSWKTNNTFRSDLAWEDKVDRFGGRQTKTLLPADERPVMKWNGNPFRIDGGGNGTSEDDGAFYLLPYWMGRYHRLLKGE